MTVAITATRLAAVIHAPACSLNVTAAAASQNIGPVTVTMTVGITVMRLMPTVLTRVSSSIMCSKLKLHFSFCQPNTWYMVFYWVYVLVSLVIKCLSP